MPTFKFIEGKPEYVFTKPKKLPSYTDRIIFRHSNFKTKESKMSSLNSIVIEKYNSLPIHMSDHLPVLLIGRLNRSVAAHHF
jgi:hypothetical protein